MAKTQIIGKNKVSTLTGLAVVGASLAILLGASMLFNYLSSIGAPYLATSIGFWLTGGALAAFVYHRYVLVYLYTLDSVKLVVERVFSKKPRFMLQILLREIVYFAPLADAESKYPKLSKQRAVRRQESLPEYGIVYKRSGETRMLVFQPDEDMIALLKEQRQHAK